MALRPPLRKVPEGPSHRQLRPGPQPRSCGGRCGPASWGSGSSSEASALWEQPACALSGWMALGSVPLCPFVPVRPWAGVSPSVNRGHFRKGEGAGQGLTPRSWAPCSGRCPRSLGRGAERGAFCPQSSRLPTTAPSTQPTGDGGPEQGLRAQVPRRLAEPCLTLLSPSGTGLCGTGLPGSRIGHSIWITPPWKCLSARTA